MSLLPVVMVPGEDRASYLDRVWEENQLWGLPRRLVERRYPEVWNDLHVEAPVDHYDCVACRLAQQKRWSCPECHPQQRVPLAETAGNYVCAKHGKWLPASFTGSSPPASRLETFAQRRLDELQSQGMTPCTWWLACALLTAFEEWSLCDAVVLAEDLLGGRFDRIPQGASDVLRQALSKVSPAGPIHLGERARQTRFSPAPPAGLWDSAENGPQPSKAQNQVVVAWRCHQEQHQFWARAVEVLSWGGGCTTCRLKERGQMTNDAPQLGEIGVELVNPTGKAAAALGPWSQRKVTWLCGAGHEYLASPSDRHRGSGCPYCRGRAVLSGFNDLLTLSPSVALEWDRAANGGLSPSHVLAGAGVARWWRCPAGHKYQASPKKRHIRSGGCPICAGRELRVGVNDLASVRPALAGRVANEQDARRVTLSSRETIEWLCVVGHRYPMRVAHVTSSEIRCTTCSSKSE